MIKPFVLFTFLLVNVVRCESDLSLFQNHLDVLKVTKDVTPKCLEQLKNLSDRTILTMIDSSSKIPSGVLQGNFFDLGNFDGCVNIESHTSIGPMNGKYCLGTISLPSLPKISGMNLMINWTKQQSLIPNRFLLHPELRMLGPGGDAGLHLAVCVPHACTADDLSSMSSLQKFKERFCYSKAEEIEYSAGFYATMIIIGIFLLFVILSTINEITREKLGMEPPHQLLLAFSAYSNGRKLVTSTNNPDQLLCLNGIKSISMMWVILGHCYLTAGMSPVANMLYLFEYQKQVENMFLMSAQVSVDTFFVVTGLVTVYTFLKSQDKKAEFNVGLYYLHRYLRLTPALAIMVLIYLYVLNYLGNGPTWSIMDATFAAPCRTSWWATIFYVENYEWKYCVAQSWYLSVDMQLFLLSPLVLLPLAKWPRYTLYGLFCLCILGVIIPFTIGYVYKFSNLGGNAMDFQNIYYTQTYARFGPYVIGMLLGYYIYKFKKHGPIFRMDWTIACLLWAISLGGLLACVYAPHELVDTQLSDGFMLGFQKQCWALFLSIVIYLCVTGYGGVVDRFLSHPIFQFLTKVSYCMYLTHMAIIAVKFFSLKTNFAFSNIEMVATLECLNNELRFIALLNALTEDGTTGHGSYKTLLVLRFSFMQFWGFFMVCLVLSVALCLTFESPFIIIEKVLFGQRNNERVKKNPVV